jgi:hypothetical protein
MSSMERFAYIASTIDEISSQYFTILPSDACSPLVKLVTTLTKF